MGALEVADGFVGNWAEDAVGNKVESVLEGGDVAPLLPLRIVCILG